MTLLPRDFIETREGLVFAVVAATPDEDHALAFLRYVPDSNGRRKVDTKQANAFLRDHFPRYLQHCHRRDVQVHAVPRQSIAIHHRPRDRMQRCLATRPADAVEADLQGLLALLIEKGVDRGRIGVTGSLLIGEQHAASDIDLVLYDAATFFQTRTAIRGLVAQGCLGKLDEAAWRDAHDRRNCALALGDFIRHERRKDNKGLVAGRKFDLALVDETDTHQPEHGWRKAGLRCLQARVIDDSRSYHQPARYGLDHPEVSEIYSFTHTYVGQACAGEWVEAQGHLEIAPDGRARLIVGSSREAPGEYIRVLWNPTQL